MLTNFMVVCALSVFVLALCAIIVEHLRPFFYNLSRVLDPIIYAFIAFASALALAFAISALVVVIGVIWVGA